MTTQKRHSCLDTIVDALAKHIYAKASNFFLTAAPLPNIIIVPEVDAQSILERYRKVTAPSKKTFPLMGISRESISRESRDSTSREFRQSTSEGTNDEWVMTSEVSLSYSAMYLTTSYRDSEAFTEFLLMHCYQDSYLEATTPTNYVLPINYNIESVSNASNSTEDGNEYYSQPFTIRATSTIVSSRLEDVDISLVNITVQI